MKNLVGSCIVLMFSRIVPPEVSFDGRQNVAYVHIIIVFSIKGASDAYALNNSVPVSYNCFTLPNVWTTCFTFCLNACQKLIYIVSNVVHSPYVKTDKSNIS